MNRGKRHAAWRNLLVGAINAGLTQMVFGLKPGENWRLPLSDTYGHESFTFRFDLFGRPVIANARDVGWDELRVQAIMDPTGRAPQCVDSGIWMLSPRERKQCCPCAAVAHGWLERRTGPYLMEAIDSRGITVRRDALQVLAEMPVDPAGYGDTGPFRL